MGHTEHGMEILSDAECRRLLERGHVGRVIVGEGDASAVLPMNYGVIGGEILVFTGAGTTLAAAATGQRVMFQIDEVDLAQESGWSVLVKGTATVGDIALRRRAEAIGVYPWPGGERHVLVRIRPDVITGRRIPTGRQPLQERRRWRDRRRQTS